MEDDKLIQAVKNVAKKLLKAKVAVIIIVAFLLTVILFAGGVYFITIDDGTFKEDDWANTQYTVSQKATLQVDPKAITSSIDGYSYNMKLDEKVKDIIQTLDDNNGNLDDYLSTKNKEEYLKTFIKAELITQYPDLRSASKVGTPVAEDDFQGCIQVRRAVASSENGETTVMTYIPLETFKAYVDGNKEEDKNELMKHFTIDEEGNIVVAGWTSVTNTVMTNVENEEKSVDKFEFTEQKINYKEMLQNYTMPFDFLWALLVIGENEDFVYDVAQLALNSKIVLEVQDNLSVDVSKEVEEYTIQTKKDRFLKLNVTIDGESYSKSKTALADDYPGNSIEEEYKYIIRTVTSKYNTVNIDITEADTWIVKYINKYTNNVPESMNPVITDNTQPDSVDKKEDEEYPEEPQDKNKILDSNDTVANAELQIYRNELEVSNSVKPDEYTQIKQVTANTKGSTYDLYSRKIKQKTTYYSATASNSYTRGIPEIIEKTDKNAEEDNFVKLFVNSGVDNKNNILTAEASWLFEIIEKNQSTAEMLDLIKYLLYKATGNDYGVTEFDFSIYEINKFNSYSYGDILTEYIKAWENNTLRKYINGETNYSSYLSKYITEDKKYYICYTDLNDTRNYGFGVCHWSGKQWNQVKRYNELGINIKDSKYNQLGTSKLEVEIVDQVRDMELQTAKQYVIDKVTEAGLTLSENQIVALTAIKYQYGNIGNFTEVYKSNPENIRTELVVNGYKPFVTGYKRYSI